MFCALECEYTQSEESVMDEYPNSMFVMRVDDLTDSEGYLLAVSTSPMTAIMFIEYLVRNKYVKYLRVGGFVTNLMLSSMIAKRNQQLRIM